jgi:hypothetical protein
VALRETVAVLVVGDPGCTKVRHHAGIDQTSRWRQTSGWGTATFLQALSGDKRVCLQA